MELPITKISAEEQIKIIDQKLTERVDIQKLVHESNPNYLANRAIVYELCKNDFVYFCNNFAWLQDPESEDEKDKNIPFLLYLFQEESARYIIDAIEKGYDIPIQKSRKMGLSWEVICILTWGFAFRNWDVLVGSEKASKVDVRGDIGALIPKARFILQNTPEWLIPRLDKKQYDKTMLLVNPVNGAKFKGDSNSVDFGRGDRAKVVLLDEFASFSQTDKQAWASSSSTAKCRIALSTPNHRGKSCYYYSVVKNAKDKDLPYLTLHWTLHPIFSEGLTYKEDGSPTSPWYENECRRSTTPQEIAQELDINFEASATGKVFPDFDYEKNIVENLEYNPNLPLYVSWDFGLDQTALIWFQPDRANNVINIIDEYVNDGSSDAGSDIYTYIDIVDSKPYQQAIHFGDPHSGNNRNLAARGASNGSILTRAGIRFKKFEKVPKINERISAGRNLMSQIRISDKCILTIDMFSSWQMKRQLTGNTNGSIPEHNIHSHLGDSYSYFAYGYQEKKKATNTTEKKQYNKTLSGVML